MAFDTIQAWRIEEYEHMLLHYTTLLYSSTQKTNNQQHHITLQKENNQMMSYLMFLDCILSRKLLYFINEK